MAQKGRQPPNVKRCRHEWWWAGAALASPRAKNMLSGGVPELTWQSLAQRPAGLGQPANYVPPGPCVEGEMSAAGNTNRSLPRRTELPWV